ncbi:hypothetical protein ACFQVC_27580 [Streptomyces monticola]|uniref:Peptidase inhibitor family I36 protein n=1 Tax=Streptomyces monticola TaxID=2666263 RepID=A0ABW2JQ84_9ACTN
MRLRGLGRAAAVLVVAGATAATLTGPAAQAETGSAAASWKCTGGWDKATPAARWRYHASCTRSGEGFSAYFQPYDEILWVYDNFPNNRKTVAHLSVQGNGNASFRTGKHDESYAENLNVSIRVCSSSSSAAKCSDTYSKGHT